ncbi:MAG: RimK family alpha-L-glutamate ligase [Candidatus Bathyarchaeota archaeon]|nr:RimK family alpha-L-glutamate ligase [Candidatus Bathyarchaeota archaeon]
MKIGILTRNEESWCSSQLIKALRKRNVESLCLNFSNLVAKVGELPYVSFREMNLLDELTALLVRPIGRCSTEEIIFQMDVLHKLNREGLIIINHPSAIEKAVDKYYTLSLLKDSGLPVPRTIATRSIKDAIRAFKDFGGEAIIKPLFGSRGIGTARISDADVAERVFRTLKFYRHVIYIQEYIPHGNKDVRTFVVGNEIISSMRRISDSWKTNISKGAKPTKMKIEGDIKEMSLRAAKAIGCEIAGVDLMETNKGLFILEVNSQPGWRGLQSISEVNIAGKIIDYLIQKCDR